MILPRPLEQYRKNQRARRGSVIVIVMWTIALAAIIVSSVQLLGYRQATFGGIAVDRVRARWAARSGLEYTLAVMGEHTEFPEAGDRFAMVRDMEFVSSGDLIDAWFDIAHAYDGVEWKGPADEHSKMNVNTVSAGMLMILDDMTLDIADAISDWRDDDSEPGSFGVEAEYYQGLETPYEPRNANLRSLAELELVAGIWPDLLRGEDWNLDGRLDPNENDGEMTMPLDIADSLLDGGWSQHLTTYSRANGATESGLPRIYLRHATPEELVERCGVNDPQARSLIYYGRDETNTLVKLSQIQLARVNARGNVGQQNVNPRAGPVSHEDLQALMEEVSITDPLDRVPGKLNLNTVPPRLFRDLMELLGAEDYVTDEILYRRDANPEGIASIAELLDIPDLEERVVDSIRSLFDTRSNVFTVAVKGWAAGSELEVEIIAVIDRSTVPVKIIEYREQ